MEVSELNVEQLAFYNHHTLEGTTFELIERRNLLRDSLVKNTVLGSNRKPATLAMAQLQSLISPAETPAEKQEKVETNFIRMAQKFSDQGNTHMAAELLKKINLETSVLVDSPDFGVRKRIKEASEEYTERKDKAIASLRLSRGVGKREASAFFSGMPDLRGLPEKSKPFIKADPHSMAAVLQAEINKTFFFDPQRPIE